MPSPSRQIGTFRSVLFQKCPRCRQGNMFHRPGLFVYKNPLDMPEHCSHCGQKFEIEPGFWIGSLWASYPIVVAIETPFLMLALFAETVRGTALYFTAMVFAFALFFPLMIRLGRTIWAHVFIRYSPQEFQ
jgi:hypothetical protein